MEAIRDGKLKFDLIYMDTCRSREFGIIDMSDIHMFLVCR